MSDQSNWEQAQQAMKVAVQQILNDAEWGPPGGGIVSECVVVAGWVDHNGTYGQSHLRCGSPWGTEGLMSSALRAMRYVDDFTNTEEEHDDDDS